jgi:hypothetical protein
MDIPRFKRNNKVQNKEVKYCSNNYLQQDVERKLKRCHYFLNYYCIGLIIVSCANAT